VQLRSIWAKGDFYGHFVGGDGRFDRHTLSRNYRLVRSCVVDESLFSFIPLALAYPFDSCSVLNYSSLVCFHLLGFIGPLFQIWVIFALFGLIFIFNYF